MYYEKVPSDAELEAQPLKPLTISKSTSPRIHAQRLADEHGVPLRTNNAWLRLQIVLACIAYALVGPTLVMCNNHILKQLHFPYPLILSSIGLMTTAVVCSVTLRVGAMISAQREAAAAATQPAGSPGLAGGADGDSARRGIEGPLTPSGGELSRPASAASGMPSVSFGFWLRNMVPIGAAQGLTFFGTNAAYMYLTITFTQMLAAFTPTVTLVLLYLTGIEIPTRRSSVSVVLITCGCVISSYGEVQFDLVGVACASAATRTAALSHLAQSPERPSPASALAARRSLAGHLLGGAAPRAHAEAAKKLQAQRDRVAVLPRAHRRRLPARRRVLLRAAAVSTRGRRRHNTAARHRLRPVSRAGRLRVDAHVHRDQADQFSHPQGKPAPPCCRAARKPHPAPPPWSLTQTRAWRGRACGR